MVSIYCGLAAFVEQEPDSSKIEAKWDDVGAAPQSTMEATAWAPPTRFCSRTYCLFMRAEPRHDLKADETHPQPLISKTSRSLSRHPQAKAVAGIMIILDAYTPCKPFQEMMLGAHISRSRHHGPEITNDSRSVDATENLGLAAYFEFQIRS